MDGVYHILEQAPRYGNRTDIETAGRMPDSTECVLRVNLDFTRRRLRRNAHESALHRVCANVTYTVLCLSMRARAPNVEAFISLNPVS